MKIRNTYIKRLSFIFDDIGNFSIDTNEELEVSDGLGQRLLLNCWIKKIEEHQHVPIEIAQEEKVERKKKRKRSIKLKKSVKNNLNNN
jgi:hypothetical protein